MVDVDRQQALAILHLKSHLTKGRDHKMLLKLMKLHNCFLQKREKLFRFQSETFILQRFYNSMHCFLNKIKVEHGYQANYQN